MADKYLKGGALNPAWCDEQDAKIETESIINSLYNLFDQLDINLNIQLGDSIGIGISKDKNLKDMCINTEGDYEAKFKFIKNHSDTPENLKLAKEIIGL